MTILKYNSQAIQASQLASMVDQKTLENMVEAMRPVWTNLSDDEKVRAKTLAASMMLGSAEAAFELQKLCFVWWPLPIPLPREFGASGGVSPMSAIGAGLILIGIGLLLL